MNPYDLNALIHARHAQHVVLIHFPIALFLAGVFLDVIAQWTKRMSLRSAARWNLMLAALATVPVLITGLLAWQWALEGQRLKGILLQHLVLACVSSVLIWLVGWLHFRADHSSGKSLPFFRLPVELIAAALIGLTAHLGGFLSGVNLPG